LRPAHVELTHQRIPASREFDRFLGHAVQFRAGMDEVSFSRRTGKLPIASADPYLNKLLTEHCERLIIHQRVRTGAIQAQVENAIAELLPHGRASVEFVAKKLGIGRRTLRRRLADEGVSFAVILRELRLELAQQYLAERNLSISRIAWLLGYAEVSGFSHAFRRWTGQAPRAERTKKAGASQSARGQTRR
jgi:AraC-like DNA-binding protein